MQENIVKQISGFFNYAYVHTFTYLKYAKTQVYSNM